MLLTEEERMLQQAVREFADRELVPRAAGYDEREEFPWDNVRELSQLGLMGLTIPEEFGGAGASAAQLAIAIEEIARGCASTSVVHLTHLSLGSDAIVRYGSPEQRQRHLPALASGEHLAAFALTEPSSGSDAADMQTTAGRRDGHYLLNGSKTFITNGPEADVTVVFTSTDRTKGSRGISAFLVEKGAKGLTINPQKGKMGMRGSSTAELVFADCEVAEAERMGEEGDGFRIAMAVIDSSRISVAAQAVGIGRAALEAAVRYAQQRHTFGEPLAERQAVQFMLADMATRVDAARLLTRRAAQLKDAGAPHGRRGGHGQGLRVGGRALRLRPCRADLRRLRLLPRERGRAAVPRRPCDGDLRGHQRDTAHRHRPLSPEGDGAMRPRVTLRPGWPGRRVSPSGAHTAPVTLPHKHASAHGASSSRAPS